MTLVTLGELLDAGVHFGHQSSRWNPKMFPYIYTEQNGIHVIDLVQTARLLTHAYNYVQKASKEGKQFLFIGTKRQAAGIMAKEAKKCGAHYINHRWLGGMMTNWKTISNSIRRLKVLEEQLGENSDELTGLTKKEMLKLTREHEKLDRSLGGIKDMGGLPDIVFVLDTNKESIAVAEANKLNIPVIGVLDSNSNPEGIDYPIPGNDDSIRAINFYCDMIAGSVLSGIQTEMTESGADIGEWEVTPAENLDEDPNVGTDAVTSVAPEVAPDPEVDAKLEVEKKAVKETKLDGTDPVEKSQDTVDKSDTKNEIPEVTGKEVPS